MFILIDILIIILIGVQFSHYPLPILHTPLPSLTAPVPFSHTPVYFWHPMLKTPRRLIFTYIKPEFFIIRALCQLLNSIRVFSLDFLVDKKLYFFQVYAICRHPLSISLHKVFFNKTFIEAKIRILEGFLDGTDPSS
jgi:hypothetical protein